MITLEKIGYNDSEISEGLSNCRKIVSDALIKMFILHMTGYYKVKPENRTIRKLALWLSVNIQKINFAEFQGHDTEPLITDVVTAIIEVLTNSGFRNISGTRNKLLIKDLMSELLEESKFISKLSIDSEFPKYREYMVRHGQYFNDIERTLNKIFKR